MHKVSGTITVMPPFKLSLSARFIEMFRQMDAEQEVRDGDITKAMMIRGQTILLKLNKQELRIATPSHTIWCLWFL